MTQTSAWRACNPRAQILAPCFASIPPSVVPPNRRRPSSPLIRANFRHRFFCLIATGSIVPLVKTAAYLFNGAVGPVWASPVSTSLAGPMLLLTVPLNLKGGLPALAGLRLSPLGPISIHRSLPAIAPIRREGFSSRSTFPVVGWPRFVSDPQIGSFSIAQSSSWSHRCLSRGPRQAAGISSSKDPVLSPGWQSFPRGRGPSTQAGESFQAKPPNRRDSSLVRWHPFGSPPAAPSGAYSPSAPSWARDSRGSTHPRECAGARFPSSSPGLWRWEPSESRATRAASPPNR